MKLVEWFKWRVAPREMEELERWRIQWEEHRRWFAEFPIAAVTLDHFKAKVEREPVTSIHVVRDSCRSADLKQVRQKHITPPQQQQAEPVQKPKYMAKSNGRHSPLLTHMMNKRTALEQQAEPDRRALQAEGKHPAPCARHCEAKAFEIEIRSLESRLKQQAEPVACKPLCELCVKRGYDFCANAAKTTPIVICPTTPQRKPLTDEEILDCWKQAYETGRREYDNAARMARVIEAAHNIKE